MLKSKVTTSANPVNLKENKLFAMPNYGSAMSPFYTVLALWVGALLMVSLLTVEVHEEGANYKSHEVYFGRLFNILNDRSFTGVYRINGRYILTRYVRSR